MNENPQSSEGHLSPKKLKADSNRAPMQMLRTKINIKNYDTLNRYQKEAAKLQS